MGGVPFVMALVLLLLNQFISKYAASFNRSQNTTFDSNSPVGWQWNTRNDDDLVLSVRR
jgi:hypothetical protein